MDNLKKQLIMKRILICFLFCTILGSCVYHPVTPETVVPEWVRDSLTRITKDTSTQIILIKGQGNNPSYDYIFKKTGHNTVLIEKYDVDQDDAAIHGALLSILIIVFVLFIITLIA